MKNLILLLSLFLLSSSVFAVDPNDTPELVLDCDAPLERVDGVPIPLSDIDSFVWEVSTDSTANKTWKNPINIVQSSACQAIVDLTELQDGQYYFTPKVSDIDGRWSQRAYDVDPTEVIAILVKRITNPKHPTAVRGLVK